MTNDSIQEFIKNLPISDSDKSTLLTDLENGADTKTILAKAQTLLDNEEKTISGSDSEGAKVYAAIKQDYAADVSKASDEFDQKMKSIEDEAEQVNIDTSKQLDQIRLDELNS